MAENEEVTEVVETPEPYESESARYIRVRREAKEEAAVTMAAEAKAAQAAKKKALPKGVKVEGLDEFNKEAARVEKSINTKPEVKES